MEEITRDVAGDYIQYRLGANNFTWENGRQADVNPDKYQEAMRSLGDEFETRFRSRFDDMIQKLHLTRDNAQDTFHAIVAETFSDGANWGRIVALFGFAGRFAIECFKNEMPEMVDHIVDWVTSYVNTVLRSWMLENKSWVSIEFLTYFIF